MGLSASQARLLTLTTRLHTVEGEAQRLMAGKLRLSNDSDRVYQKYINALDEVTLKTRQINNATGDDCWINATVNSLMRYDASDETTGSVFYVQNMKDGTLYMPADICNFYDSASDERDFAEKFGVKYTRIDENESMIINYQNALKKGWDTLIAPTEEETEALLAAYDKAVDKDRSKKLLASTMLTNIPGISTDGLYETKALNDARATGFKNVIQNVISSTLYETAYTAAERGVIEAAYDMASGSADATYPEDTVTATDFNGGTKTTTVTYLMSEIKATYNTKDYAKSEAKKFSGNDIFEMMLNGGTRTLTGTKRTTETYEYYFALPQTSTDVAYTNAEDIYDTAVINGSTAKSILNSYNSSITRYGEALTKIFTRVSNECTFEEDFLTTNGLTNQDIVNYRKYAEYKSDYEHYTPLITFVPDDKVKAEYYEQVYNAIKAAGGYTKIFDATAQSSSWVTNMVKSAQVILTTWDYETETLSKTADSLHYNLREIADNNAIEVAGQKYEDELTTINAKDARYDTRLEKLDSERSAITTEIESLKQVAKENVESTFKLYT
ncbi:MAG: hypothetical protein K6E29_08700 [Cyanobacteria bacterium RUI128]|nr:hypothetical protein [Cyanobacteria bacterium RUI128]